MHKVKNFEFTQIIKNNETIDSLINDVETLIGKYSNDVMNKYDILNSHRFYKLYKELLIDLKALKLLYNENIN